MKRSRYGKTAGSSRSKTCEGKVKFASHGHAHKVMMLTKERKGLVAETRVYACSVCGGFHWGHATGTIVDRSQRVRNAIDKALARDAALRAKSAEHS